MQRTLFFGLVLLGCSGAPFAHAVDAVPPPLTARASVDFRIVIPETLAMGTDGLEPKMHTPSKTHTPGRRPQLSRGVQLRDGAHVVVYTLSSP